MEVSTHVFKLVPNKRIIKITSGNTWFKRMNSFRIGMPQGDKKCIRN